VGGAIPLLPLDAIMAQTSLNITQKLYITYIYLYLYICMDHTTNKFSHSRYKLSSTALNIQSPEYYYYFFVFFFFFFFYWHYNTMWVLALSVIVFHSSLSLHCFLHRLIPIICISSSMSTIHLFLGLPLILVPTGFYSNTLLGVLLSSIRIT
jgi:hypothetical protein